ncbi:hypothetical protein ANTPLA_LOCUS8081 [Anthophora plagiata]
MNKQARNVEKENPSDNDNLDVTIVGKKEAMTRMKRSGLAEGAINSMKVNELKEKMVELNLENTEKKEELRQRLRTYVNAKNEDEKENEADAESEKESESEDEEQLNRERRRVRSCKESVRFTIKDVENSMSYFTGDDKLPIKKMGQRVRRIEYIARLEPGTEANLWETFATRIG